jgi:DNA-binding IclR family transcriptional regulator
MSDDESSLPPVKSIARAADVLRILAKEAKGVALTDVARRAGLGKATAHRILSALIDEGFAFQDRATRLYQLGAALGELSRKACRRDVGALAQPILSQLAKETEDTIYVHIQEGLRSVCVGREQGSFPIRTLSLDVGQTRPLGVGSGSIALLAFLPEQEIEAIIEANQRWYAEFPSFGPDAIRSFVRQTRSQGYSFIEGQMTPNISAIGVPVLDDQERPIAALSVTAISDRVRGQRALWLASLLRQEAADLASLIQKSRD